MDPARWRLVERLYHEAQARSADERAAFLAEACANDEALQREVVALLDSPATAEGFLARPAIAMAAAAETTGASVMTNRRLGVYLVQERIGAGGMGEVYRARDTRLGRDVAIKILPRAFTTEPDRLARFEREARALAALNHAHIATIHGVEEGEGIHALVMELVDGETLGERIARTGAKGLPIKEALDVARQIADALDAAHEKGIVHRDLKPANIKIATTGAVKVLDFGLAKAAESDVAPADAPTLTVDRTGQGAIVGTAAYMSPEQARGLAVDKRTDIWAFGCVLYEMLTGSAAFAGGTVSDVIAAILEREPDWSRLPAGAPPSVRRLLRRCLAKNPRERLRHIGDALLELDEVEQADVPRSTPRHPGGNRWAVVASVGALTMAAVAAIIWGVSRPGPEPLPLSRFAIVLPEDLPVLNRATRDVAISRDGRHVVYATTRGVAVRPIDRVAARLVESTATISENSNLFLSPDGDWIAFTEGVSLKKIPLAGGAPVTIADVGAGASGTWTPSGIVYANLDGLFRIGPDGGPAQPLKMAPLGSTEQALYPEMLPGGNVALITIVTGRTHAVGTDVATAVDARIEAVDLRTGERRLVLRSGGAGRYSATGHLLYGAGRTLHAVPFNGERAEVVGPSIEVVSDSGADFAVSENGSLVYVSGGSTGDSTTMVWIDRQGRERPLEAPPQRYIYPRLSPDRTRVAVNIAGSDRDVWIWDTRSKSLERLTQDPADDATLTWTPDGRHVIFGSARIRGIPNLFVQPADGSGEARRIQESARTQQPLAFAPDGRLIFSQEVAGRSRDILAMTMDDSHRVQSLIDTPGFDLTADVSPDGRWIAYDSDESGRFEVYVRPYPNTSERRWQISNAGGKHPRWSRDGRELYYRDLSTSMMAVGVATTPTLAVLNRTTLFSRADLAGTGAQAGGLSYDLGTDDEHFLMIKQGERPSVVLVQHWFGELMRLAPRP